jgi:ankyrin repeat protein
MDEIFLACRTGDLAAVRELVSADPKIVNARQYLGSTPLHVAARNDRIEVTKFLVVKGADIHATTKSGATPLHSASLFGSLDTAELLIADGANVNARDTDGWAPLHSAARCDHLGIAKILVSKGADVNVINKNGMAPLHYATRCGNLDVVMYLWPLTDCAPSDTEYITIKRLDHAARMCLLFAECGFTSDMITFS